MPFFRTFVPVLLSLMMVSAAVLACGWDRDTITRENLPAPSTLELITGKFHRHSSYYYFWRIEDRKQRLLQEPGNLRLLDDLSVGYDKVGQYDLAIKTMLEKEKLAPGEYETHANLGTHYLHSGDFENGLKHIRKAIEINPDAHFGREIYQQLLAEYLLTRRGSSGPVQLPLADPQHQYPDFPAYVLDARKIPDDPTARTSELRKAIRGVEGMMWFGQYDSPVLLEVLAELLLANQADIPEAHALAARACLKASFQVKEDPVVRAYREKAAAALKGQNQFASLEELEQKFEPELRAAELWFAELEQNEQIWKAQGKDLDAKFDQTYILPQLSTFQPPSSPQPGSQPSVDVGAQLRVWAEKGLLILLVIAMAVFLVFRRKGTEPGSSSAQLP